MMADEKYQTSLNWALVRIEVLEKREAAFVEALAMSTAELMNAARVLEAAGEHQRSSALMAQCDFNRSLISPSNPTPVSREAALVEALRSLHAMVWGECSSLLDEDSGGDAKLDLCIRELIKPNAA